MSLGSDILSMLVKSDLLRRGKRHHWVSHPPGFESSAGVFGMNPWSNTSYLVPGIRQEVVVFEWRARGSLFARVLVSYGFL
jgi:hypothetical protein